MRYHRSVLIAICAASLWVLSLVSPLQANEDSMQATVDKPATIAISGASERALVDGATRIVVTINAYEPSKTGPVATVVSVRCGDDVREIGRFGIFPDEAFSVSRGTKPQRFGFPLPNDLACRRTQTVIIHLEPQTGNGAGASITVGGANIE